MYNNGSSILKLDIESNLLPPEMKDDQLEVYLLTNNFNISYSAVCGAIKKIEPTASEPTTTAKPMPTEPVPVVQDDEENL